MSRRVLVALSFITFAIPGLASAQSVEIGLKGGVVFAQLPDYMDVLRDLGADDVRARTGVVFGAHVAIPLGGGVALQPEALYTQRGASARLPFGVGDFDLKLDYLDIPVLLRVGPSSGRGFQFLAGPSFNFNTKAELVLDVPFFNEPGGDIKDQVESLDIGVVLGGGYYGPGFLVEGRYEEGLTNVVNLPAVLDQTQDYKNRTFSVMFGIRFGG
jgi:hypothetical protein